MNQLLQYIELDLNDLDSFMIFVENIKASWKPIVYFYDHEIKKSSENNNQDPPLHIIAKVDGKIFKRVLVD